MINLKTAGDGYFLLGVSFHTEETITKDNREERFIGYSVRLLLK